VRVRGDLIPYLVRGVLANLGGSFYGWVANDELRIMNGTLGCVSMAKAPVIVFADHEVKRLVVSVSSAF
jgi:hypothetical protein